MFRAIAAFALASASAHSTTTATLTSTLPWWERVTVTVGDDGKPKSCRYETSLQPGAPQDCSASGDGVAAKAGSGSGSKDEYTSITFERRYTPGATPKTQSLQPGETLLGGQVMALAIDGRGAVKGCKVVATTGGVTPDYGCDEAAAERFEASAGSAHATAPEREGYMSVIVYGHPEHMV
ncbi:MAG: hypothetical protein ACJ8FI_01625 [Sphingomicrobium sp.]